MMVVILAHFCDFAIDYKAVLCHILCMYYKYLKSHGAGYGYFDPLSRMIFLRIENMKDCVRTHI